GDFIRGLWNRKLWFPCKILTLNAASLTIVAIATKLPVDLNNSMPATMDSKELFANIIALAILVIILVVNVCIQIDTDVIRQRFQHCDQLNGSHLLEAKYQTGHETAIKALQLQQSDRISVEKLTQHVSNHWVMAETGSPQFCYFLCFWVYWKSTRRYVLQQLHDSMELSERTLKSILNYDPKGKKAQSNNLIKLLEESRSFEGVGKYDILQDPTSPEAYIDCWSLALVTLTSITSSLPKIQNETFKSFLKGVREGLAYVTDVEKSLNATDDYITTQKAAKKLWEEVDIHHKWLGNMESDINTD
ncbi:hypothetical protein Tco_1127392, partial [Tanacetum coccineum]